MRPLVLSALALVPLWSAAQAPADPAPAAVHASPPAPAQPTPGPQPIAIEPAAGPSSPQPVAQIMYYVSVFVVYQCFYCIVC
jgi:hypothetical protein